MLRGVGKITVSPNGNSVFVTSGMSTISEYSTQDKSLLYKYTDKENEYPYPIKQMECTREKLMYIRSNGVLYVWATTPPFPRLLHRLEIRGKQCLSFAIGALSVGGELTTIFCVYDDGSVVAWGIGTTGLLKTIISKEPRKEVCMTFGKGSLYCTSKELILETGTEPKKVLFQIPDNDYDPLFQKQILIDDTFVYFKYAKGTMCRVDTQTQLTRYYVINDCLFCVWNGFIFVSNRNNKIHQYTESGQRMQTIKNQNSEITCMLICNDKLYSSDEEGGIFIYELSAFEEDSDTWTALSLDNSVILSDASVDHCSNSGILSLEPYTKQDDPIIIYMLDSTTKYRRAICFTSEELQSFIESDRNKEFPDHIMTVYSKPKHPDTTGIGAYPTGRIVVKLPVHNIYVTVGSVRKLLSTKKRVWYAVPLFGQKRRRIGNLKGIFGISMNHGQIPGDVVYKLVSEQHKHELNGVESESDYPFNLTNVSNRLTEIMGMDSSDFVNKLIDDIVHV